MQHYETISEDTNMHKKASFSQDTTRDDQNQENVPEEIRSDPDNFGPFSFDDSNSTKNKIVQDYRAILRHRGTSTSIYYQNKPILVHLSYREGVTKHKSHEECSRDKELIQIKSRDRCFAAYLK